METLETPLDLPLDWGVVQHLSSYQSAYLADVLFEE